MRFDEYRAMDATALAQAVRDGETTPSELLDVAQRRLEKEMEPVLCL